MATPMYKAIKAINPTAQFTCVGDDYSSIVWSSGTSVISEADINAEQSLLKFIFCILNIFWSKPNLS